jgi:putative nucleotidyltransferase with HDIG domain
MPSVPQPLQGAPELSTAESDALAVLTEHARESARLACIWLFAHAPDPESETAVEPLARACVDDPGPLADTVARAATVRAARGDRRRFARGADRPPAGGPAVATAAGEGIAVSAAGEPARAAGSPEGRRALADLAAVALRLLSDPVAAAPAVPAEADDAEPERQAAFGPGLANSLALLEQPPILAESRSRLAEALEPPNVSLNDAVRAIETDVGLALAVATQANRRRRSRGGIGSIGEAVAALGPAAVTELAESLPVLRPTAPADPAGTAIARISPHAIATRAAADMIALRIGMTGREQLRLAALLHDVGKVALATASTGYLDRGIDPSVTPDSRAERERRRLGIDHAGLGAIALGRLGLPKSVTEPIEGHHGEDARGPAAAIRLADMLAHEVVGHAVDPSAVAATGKALGIDAAGLRALAYDLARAGGPRTLGAEPSPLTPMQLKVLRSLRQGKTYKQIAASLNVSESTVRSHLHKTYERLGVVDRAQAVLLAHDRGWI